MAHTTIRSASRAARFIVGSCGVALAGLALGACSVPVKVTTETGAPAPRAGAHRAVEVPGIGADLVLDGRTYYEEAQLREELIVHCMARSGLRYVANPPFIASTDGTTPEPPADPNEALRAEMSPEELEAYDMALAGVPDANAIDLAPMEERTDGGGCLGLAHEMVPGLYRVDPQLTTAAARLRQSASPQNARGCLEERLGIESPQALDEAVIDGSISTEELAEGEAACADEADEGAEEAEAELLVELQRFVDDNADRVDAYLGTLEDDRGRAAEYLAS